MFYKNSQASAEKPRLVRKLLLNLRGFPFLIIFLTLLIYEYFALNYSDKSKDKRPLNWLEMLIKGEGEKKVNLLKQIGKG